MNEKVAIVFSDSPGCRERHLIRKHQNPIFISEKSALTQSDVDDAREDDSSEYEEFIEDFNDLLADVSGLEGKVETEVVLEIKEQIDRMYDRCASFGEDHSKYKGALVKLHDTIMTVIRQAAGVDSVAMKELDREQQARELHLELMEYKLVSDLLRADSPIQDNELVPTLLSEDSESVQVVMSLFEEEQKGTIRDEAKGLVSRLRVANRLSEKVQQAYDAMMSQKQ